MNLRTFCSGAALWIWHEVQHPSSWTHTLLPCTWSPTTSNQALHTIGGNNTYSLELLMMVLEVPETCLAYHKCNKAFSYMLGFILYACGRKMCQFPVACVISFLMSISDSMMDLWITWVCNGAYCECNHGTVILIPRSIPCVKFIQGVTGGMCETSGECSLGQTIPI